MSDRLSQNCNVQVKDYITFLLDVIPIQNENKFVTKMNVKDCHRDAFKSQPTLPPP